MEILTNNIKNDDTSRLELNVELNRFYQEYTFSVGESQRKIGKKVDTLCKMFSYIYLNFLPFLTGVNMMNAITECASMEL